MEWGSAVDWFKAVTGFLVSVAQLCLTAGSIWLFYNLFRPLMAQLGGRSGSDTPNVGVKMRLRQLFCRHSRALARGRTRWGKVTTFCAQCGADVNEGKPREEWR